MKIKETQKTMHYKAIRLVQAPSKTEVKSIVHESIDTPEKAKEIGRQMAVEVAKKLKLRLNA